MVIVLSAVGFIIFLKINAANDIIPIPHVDGGACNNTADNFTIQSNLNNL